MMIWTPRVIARAPCSYIYVLYIYVVMPFARLLCRRAGSLNMRSMVVILIMCIVVLVLYWYCVHYTYFLPCAPALNAPHSSLYLLKIWSSSIDKTYMYILYVCMWNQYGKENNNVVLISDDGPRSWQDVSFLLSILLLLLRCIFEEKRRKVLAFTFFIYIYIASCHMLKHMISLVAWETNLPEGYLSFSVDGFFYQGKTTNNIVR